MIVFRQITFMCVCVCKLNISENTEQEMFDIQFYFILINWRQFESKM